MDEAPVGAVECAQSGGGHGVQVVQRARGVADPDVSGVGGKAAGDDVQQCRLAGAAFADDGEDFARPEVDDRRSSRAGMGPKWRFRERGRRGGRRGGWGSWGVLAGVWVCG